MILFANIDRVEKDRDYYVVYTTEAYKEFDTYIKKIKL